MFGKWYKIVGLTDELFEVWKNDLRKDVIIWKENGNIEARINLNPIQAIHMERLINKNNKQQPYYKLGLVPA